MASLTWVCPALPAPSHLREAGRAGLRRRLSLAGERAGAGGRGGRPGGRRTIARLRLGRRPGSGCSCSWSPRCRQHRRRPLTVPSSPSARLSRLPAASLPGSAVLLHRRFPSDSYPLFLGAPRSREPLKELCLPTSSPRGHPSSSHLPDPGSTHPPQPSRLAPSASPHPTPPTVADHPPTPARS